ncbi:MAG: DUF805 domain-containing protein [Candidatus Ornithomonoglobus sp.]
MSSYIKCIKKYAQFKGRATRREFWGFALINAAVVLILMLFQAKFQTGAAHIVFTYLLGAYILFTFIPSLAVMSRRWHDLGRTGWWVLLNLVVGVGSVVSLCFFLCRGDEGKNFYGRDPRVKKHIKR